MQKGYTYVANTYDSPEYQISFHCRTVRRSRSRRFACIEVGTRFAYHWPIVRSTWKNEDEKNRMSRSFLQDPSVSAATYSWDIAS